MFSTVNDMKIVYPIGLPENKNSQINPVKSSNHSHCPVNILDKITTLTMKTSNKLKDLYLPCRH